MGVTVYLLCVGHGAWGMGVNGPGMLLHYGALCQVTVGNGTFLLERKAGNRFIDNGPHENFKGLAVIQESSDKLDKESSAWW